MEKKGPSYQILMGFTLKFKNGTMSEVTIATTSRDRAQPIRMQVSFDLQTLLAFLHS